MSAWTIAYISTRGNHSDNSLLNAGDYALFPHKKSIFLMQAKQIFAT